MTRSQRVKTIVKLKEHNERLAARRLIDSQSSLDSIKQRLEQMLKYREEYARLLKVSNQSHAMNLLRDRQAFILQMNQGINMLREQISIQEKMNKQERQNWIKEKQQLDTMQSIYENCLSVEQKLEVLRSQQQIDELAINSAIRNR